MRKASGIYRNSAGARDAVTFQLKIGAPSAVGRPASWASWAAECAMPMPLTVSGSAVVKFKLAVGI
jgi:hypothetical protein